MWFVFADRYDSAVLSSPRPWIYIFALPEKSNMAVTESGLDPQGPKMYTTF